MEQSCFREGERACGEGLWSIKIIVNRGGGKGVVYRITGMDPWRIPEGHRKRVGGSR